MMLDKRGMILSISKILEIPFPKSMMNMSVNDITHIHLSLITKNAKARKRKIIINSLYGKIK